MAALNRGLNRIMRVTYDAQDGQQIRDDPAVTVERYEIQRGSGIAGRDHDVPTAQGQTNGIILYYTPSANTKPEAPWPSEIPRPRKRKRGGKIVPRDTDENFAEKVDSEDEERLEPVGGHRGLGSLDTLPVSPQILFTHGSNRGIDQPSFQEFVAGLARNFPVLAFNKDTENDNTDKRVAAMNYFFNDGYGTVRAMGGRSFGARVAARTTAFGSGNKNLILWSYPLVRDMDIREEELLALSADVKVLFIRGMEDYMNPEPIFKSVREKMRAKTWVIHILKVNHGFTNLPGVAAELALSRCIGVIAGLWLRGDVSNPQKPNSWDPADGTDMVMKWNDKTKQVEWTGWATERPNMR
ncbi:hypothetical protein GGR57DRAFT_463302 [Xylariaceae sp. FL1272]|nr:hypothetical protein GGR57DRAFT_463302 [Xylariaceae sp. FL1272]